MKKLLLLIITLVFSSGCQTTADKQKQDAYARSEAATAVCGINYPSINARNAVQHTQCLINADRIKQKYRTNPDIDEVMYAKMLVASEKFQNGELTASEYNLAITKSANEANNNSNSRFNANRNSAAAAETAAAATRASTRNYTCNTSGSQYSSSTYCY